MENQNRLDHLLTEMAEMIQLIQNHRGTISANITPQVLKKIEDLEQALAIFEEINKQAFEEAGVDRERLKTEKLESLDVPSEEKNLLQRANRIASDARNLQLILSREMRQGRQKKFRKRSSGMKERKKLFKPLGGDANWIPL